MSRDRRGLLPMEEPSAEPGSFGCPMLTRAHQDRFSDPGKAMMRCSLGWALHGDIDVARCAATEAVLDCWKVHPERTPLVAVDTAIGGPGPGAAEHKASAD